MKDSISNQVRAPKQVYAQSSDIKSRTFYQYRLDMKKKGIRELEFLSFLQDTLRVLYEDPHLEVKKSGSDALLWFVRSGKQISQEPDYSAVFGIHERKYEFQMANKTPDKFFDFKVSKVGKKSKGHRKPYSDREFFYVIADKVMYAFLHPEWIMNNGQEEQVPAWRSLGYRVPVDKILGKSRKGESDLKNTLKSIEDKIYLLEFQNEYYEEESKKLSSGLQQVIDNNHEFRIMPRTLEGFFHTCFLMNKLDKRPDSAETWLIYLISFLEGNMRGIDLVRFMFSFDFLYFNIDEFRSNEKISIEDAICKTKYMIENRIREDGTFEIHQTESVLDGTRFLLATINLLEDVYQDAVINFDFDFPSIKKIFEMLPDVGETADIIRRSKNHF